MKITIIVAIAVIALLGLMVLAFAFCYKKCPPNKVMVVTGPNGSKFSRGQARFVIPFIQRVDFMSLENIQVDFVSRKEIPTKDAINVNVDAVANMAIDSDPEILKIAASKFLGYTPEEIGEKILPVLEGNIREIISQTTLKELITGNKKDFAEKVAENVEPNLRDFGLKLTTFNIQNFTDEQGLIQNLGIENIAKITKDASIAKTRAQKEVEIEQSIALNEANAAKVEAQLAIEQRNTEFRIKQAELQKKGDIEQAKADAALNIEAEKQRKVQEGVTADANLEREQRAIEIEEKKVALKEKALEADIKKTADAERYAIEQEAEAKLYEARTQAEADLYDRQKNAEAKAFEAAKEAEAEKNKADAVKYAGLAEAEAIKAKGLAEADNIRAKAEAEAEGLNKKAEAMAKYGEAAKQDMQNEVAKHLIDQLPAIASAIGEGYNGVGNITMLGGESTQLASNIMSTVTQVLEGANAVGIDLKSLLSGFLGGKAASKDNKTEIVLGVDEQ